MIHHLNPLKSSLICNSVSSPAIPVSSPDLGIGGVEEQRIVSFPPCRLVFADELLLAGSGPRSAFGRDRQTHARVAWPKSERVGRAGHTDPL